MRILFLRHRWTGRSSRRCRDADDCSRRKGVRGVDNYFIGFSDTAQDLALNAKVSSNAYVAQLHNAQVAAGGERHNAFYNSTWGLWLVFAGFAVGAVGSGLGPRRARA